MPAPGRSDPPIVPGDAARSSDEFCPRNVDGEHRPLASGDARDGGPVFCRDCQWPVRYG